MTDAFTIYQVDAFTLPRTPEQNIRTSNKSAQFSGNPAAVIPLVNWLSTECMQAIAESNNLSETVFFVKDDDGIYDIRWFTPTVEVPLCGHASLASAYVIATQLNDPRDIIPFRCQNNTLLFSARINRGDLLTVSLEFLIEPVKRIVDIDYKNQIESIVGKKITSLFRARDLIAVLENHKEVDSCTPDFTAIKQLDEFALVITAYINENEKNDPHHDLHSVDFVSRFFAPRQGILEDPVTGSSFCGLTPLWSTELSDQIRNDDRSEQLDDNNGLSQHTEIKVSKTHEKNKQKMSINRLVARQRSRRQGHIDLILQEHNVIMTGHCFLYMKGTIFIKE